MAIDQRYLTHLPALFAALLATDGPVLEIGAGPGSTPLLRNYCGAAGKTLISVDDNPAYVLEPITLLVNYDEYLPTLAGMKWGVVFVDHAPATRRAADAHLFRNSADYVVIHDWESPEIRFEPLWKYSRIDGRDPQTITLSETREIPK